MDGLAGYRSLTVLHQEKNRSGDLFRQDGSAHRPGRIRFFPLLIGVSRAHSLRGNQARRDDIDVDAEANNLQRE